MLPDSQRNWQRKIPYLLMLYYFLTQIYLWASGKEAISSLEENNNHGLGKHHRNIPSPPTGLPKIVELMPMCCAPDFTMFLIINFLIAEPGFYCPTVPS